MARTLLLSCVLAIFVWISLNVMLDYVDDSDMMLKLHDKKPRIRSRSDEDSLVYFGKVHFQIPDPEINMNASQLIESKGLPCEVHYVQTDDGYILGMQRIPRKNATGLPVLLVHGLLSSSDCFLTNLINESLAYILYAQGFDVWLGNVRGNTYSSQHATLSPNDKKFWEFSFDEMGKYDVPAMVDYVLKQTERDKLNYVGHSQGNTVMFISALTNEKLFPSKIDKFVALAPAGLVTHMASVLHYLYYVANDIAFVYDLFGDGKFLPRHDLLSRLAECFCPDNPYVCANVLFLIAGPDTSNTNVTRIPVYLAHNPSGTSVQNMLHWIQMYKSPHLKYYDYGNYVTNLFHYGSIYPPAYKLTDFNVKTYVYCGGNDSLVVPQDCNRQVSILPNVQKQKFIPSYNHLDFVFAVNANLMVYDDIVGILHSR